MIFLINFQFGNKVGKGKFSPKNAGGAPTYVYPQEIKDVVRKVITEEINDYADPAGPSVSKNILFMYFLCNFHNIGGEAL